MLKIFKKCSTNLNVRLNSLTNKKFNMNFLKNKNNHEINGELNNKQLISYCNHNEKCGNLNILKK
jgi:hypothetical protein